jgi:hypothetical protein
MTETQEKELFDIVKAILVLWAGTFPPATWSFHMRRLSNWLDSCNRGEPKPGPTTDEK